MTWGRPAAALLLLTAALPAGAGGTRTLHLDAAELARGRMDGVALTEDGALTLAPRVDPVGESRLAGGPAQIWSIAADRNGNVYLGTGPDGGVVRVRPSGENDRFFQVDEPMVTALAWIDGDTLLAGTAPGGRIYRIDATGRGAVWSETEERYIWALLPRPDGSVLVATGDRGKLLRVAPSGESRLVFDADEAHLRALADGGNGSTLAGGSGRGLVYRIDGEGHATVLYDDELDEAVALVADGSAVVAALTAAPRPAPRRPELEIRLPDGTRAQAGTASLGAELEDDEARWVRGTIEGIDGEARRADGVDGRIVRIAAAGHGETLWQSTDEAPFAVATDAQGRVLFGTGEPARVYRIETDGRVARIATLDQAQLTGVAPLGASMFLATSNPASVYRLDDSRDDAGVFVSAPLDAGATARWGALRRDAAAGPGRIEIQTRTGNSPVPDETWSAWASLVNTARFQAGGGAAPPPGSAIPNPDGRYLQWKARLIGSRAGDASLSGLEVSFEPYNRPPAVRGFRLDDAGDGGGDVKLVWSEYDPDGDPLRPGVTYSAGGPDAAWLAASPVEPQPQAETPSAEPAAPAGGPRWRERRFGWNTATLPEGEYRVRLELSDGGANPAGEGRSARPAAPLRVTVDRTPPRIEIVAEAAGDYRVQVRDAHSPIRQLTVLRDGDPQFTLRPEDGLCDSPQETFRLRWEGPGDGIVLRAVDVPGNARERTLEEEPAP